MTTQVFANSRLKTLELKKLEHETQNLYAENWKTQNSEPKTENPKVPLAEGLRGWGLQAPLGYNGKNGKKLTRGIVLRRRARRRGRGCVQGRRRAWARGRIGVARWGGSGTGAMAFVLVLISLPSGLVRLVLVGLF